ncbi:MAG: hypothetical protein JWQ14_3491 [Adhaeribacter sp.]|nr:hypothetical protein [Adhaeribacter sp.]
MWIEISKYLDVVPPFLLLVFFIFSPGINFKRDYIFWYLAAQLVLNSLSMVIYQVFDGSNLVVYNIGCVITFYILSAYFASIFQFEKIKIIIWGIAVLFLAGLVLNALKFEHLLDEFNSNMYGLAALVLVAYCFMFYLQNLLNPTQDVVHSSDFWYVTGLLSYYTSSFFIFITFNYLMRSNHQYDNGIKLLWPIHNVLFLVMCGYIFKGILCKRSPMKYT